MTSAYEVTFNPNPIQRRFIQSQARADLFASRMGEGKSAALCWAVFYHTMHNPGASWALVRDTWENLQATTMKEFFKWFPPGVFGVFNASKKTFTWTVDAMGGGEVQFLGMDDPADAGKFQSRELAGFGMDEPAPAADTGGISEMVFTTGMTRLRQPGMKWYGAKLATNNPDETHWTYEKFVRNPLPGFVAWQPETPENTDNLPRDYYQGIRELWGHRPDLVRRFVEGKFGFQQLGKAVTPQWSDDIHLATGLAAVKGPPLTLLWDFGLNPTCVVSQVTPMGFWNVLECWVGEGIGAYELIGDLVKPALAADYREWAFEHIGDPAGQQREQSSSVQSAVAVIRKELGGPWKPGPTRFHERRDPLQAVLSRTIQGTGQVQVDRHRAEKVWHALRGGWHHRIARTGVVSKEPIKNEHSHPGDAMGYGAAVLFPLGRLRTRGASKPIPHGTYFQGSGDLGQPGRQLPVEARVIGAR